MASEPSHMHFVDNRLRGWPSQRRVPFPIIISGIDHHALHCLRCVVASLASSLTTVVAWNCHSEPIRVKQQQRDAGASSEQAEIHTVAKDRRTQRRTLSGIYSKGHDFR